MDQSFTVYAVRCIDGVDERHPLDNRTKRDLALIQMTKLNRSKGLAADGGRICGPHVLVRAVISRSPWVEVADSDPETDPGELIKQGALAYACTRCGVGPNQPCENLADRKKGVRTVTAWPHPARITLWSAESND